MLPLINVALRPFDGPQGPQAQGPQEGYKYSFKPSLSCLMAALM